jgi:hypothetical protein
MLCWLLARVYTQAGLEEKAKEALGKFRELKTRPKR